MSTRTLARHRLAGAGWAHPYASPFVLYADGGDPPAGDPGTPPATPAVQPPATPPTGQDPAAQDVGSLPDWAQKIITDARADAAKARTTAKQQAADDARSSLAQQIGKALGLVQDDAPLTPEQLQQQLAEAQQQGTTAQEQALANAIELSVYRTAQTLGANADALLDSRAFCDGIDALDVDPADRAAFEAAVTERVNAALIANPTLRNTAAAGRSGPDGTPAGAAGTPPPRSTSLQQAVSRRLGRG